MPIDSKRLEKVEIRAALPGRRSVTQSKIITLFGARQKGMPTNKLVSKPLPPDLGSKTLALVGKNSKGELTLDFINESELPLNCVYIQNLTGRTFTLELPKPPSGEKSAIELPSKSTYIFGKNSTDSNISSTTPANLTYMTRLKNGKVVKVKDRGMMLTTYPGRKVVMIISPDSTGRTVVLTELMIFKKGRERLPLTMQYFFRYPEAGSCSGVYPIIQKNASIAARFFIFSSPDAMD